MILYEMHKNPIIRESEHMEASNADIQTDLLIIIDVPFGTVPKFFPNFGYRRD